MYPTCRVGTPATRLVRRDAFVAGPEPGQTSHQAGVSDRGGRELLDPGQPRISETWTMNQSFRASPARSGESRTVAGC